MPHRSFAALAAGLALVTALSTPALALEPAAEVDPATSLLMAELGVSQAEATRRLQLQAEAEILGEKLAAEHPGEYLGMWLDQANGGVLRVGMTNTALVPRLPGVVAYQAKHSMRELAATAAKVSAVVGTDAPIAVDPLTETILVNRSGATLVGLTAAQAASPVPVKVGKPAMSTQKCDPRYCTEAPLRGGVRLDIQREDGTWGGCSVGFHVRNVITKQSYVLTAGHCVRNFKHDGIIDTAYHQQKGPNISVAAEDPGLKLAEDTWENGFDYSVLPFTAPGTSYWLAGDGGRQYGPAAHSVLYFSKNLHITGYTAADAVVTGSWVCSTGSGYTPAAGESYVDSGAGAGYVPGTHCGFVQPKDASWEPNRIVVKLCARPGDSGAPLFNPATGKALGILSTGDSRSGTCIANDSERNAFEPLSRIFTRLVARNGAQYQFELVPQPTPVQLPRQ